MRKNLPKISRFGSLVPISKKNNVYRTPFGTVLQSLRVPKHTGLIGSRSFQNYAFKGWLSLETMKLWLLVLTKTLFLMTLIIKLTLGNIFIKVKNPPGGATVTK